HQERGEISPDRPDAKVKRGRRAVAKAKSSARTRAKRGSASGRAAIVTGGASGIGLGCGGALLATGGKVGVLDREEKALERPSQRFRGKGVVRIDQLYVTDEAA